MTDNLALDARQLYRDYGRYRAVAGLDIHLEQGEVLGLLGPNGAGKSSTLRMLTGNLAPAAGEISICGHDLLTHARHAKGQLGYLPERPPLYRDLSVDAYLRYCARLHGIERSQTDAAMHLAKQRCGLEAVGRRLIGNLSQGYHQRVGLAQAIIHAPPVVILDEPTIGLDPAQTHEVRRLIRDLSIGHSIVLSTHLLAEVQAVCDRVQIVHQGATVFNERLADIAHAQERDGLILGLGKPPDTATLERFEGVDAVQALGAGRYRLTTRERAALTARLARASSEHGWELTELTPGQVTLATALEQIFMERVYRESQGEDSTVAAA